GIPVRQIDYYEPPFLTTEQIPSLWNLYEPLIEDLPDAAELMTLLTPEQLMDIVG
ncbi:unnamed protein product, partial [marine sediment metagenome]